MTLYVVAKVIQCLVWIVFAYFAHRAVDDEG
jgi:hypothetical protein